MDIRDALTNTFYFTVGAAAVGLEVLSGAAKKLTEKGAEVVSLGKAEFAEYCASSRAKDVASEHKHMNSTDAEK